MRLRVVKCPNCAASVKLRSDQATATCKGCNTENAREEVLRLESDLARSHPNPTFLKLGSKARFDDKEYELTGRLVFGMREEGETYYWHEYQMIGEDGDSFFLEFEEDEGQIEWKIARPFIPTNPLDPREAAGMSAGSRVNLDGTTARVVEGPTQGKLYLVEGELTWAAEVGDSSRYIEAKSAKNFYVVEWKTEEAEFYRGEYISYGDVLVAFNNKELLHEYDRLETRRKGRQTLGVMSLFAGVISLILYAWASISGAKVQSESVPISAIALNEGYTFPPFALDAADGVHRMELSGSMSQSSAWVVGVLVSEDDIEVLGEGEDFWDETGSDEDGPWHESSLSVSKFFVLKESGNYRVRVYIEKDRLVGNYQTVGYTIYKRAIYPDYFIVSAVIGIGLGALLLVWLASDRIVWDGVEAKRLELAGAKS